MKISEAIKICRIKKKVQQKDLAEKLGISQSLLSMIEKGSRDPGFELTENIAKKLGVPCQLIFFLACDAGNNQKKYKKQIDAISAAAIDILTRID